MAENGAARPRANNSPRKGPGPPDTQGKAAALNDARGVMEGSIGRWPKKEKRNVRVAFFLTPSGGGGSLANGMGARAPEGEPKP